MFAAFGEGHTVVDFIIVALDAAPMADLALCILPPAQLSGSHPTPRPCSTHVLAVFSQCPCLLRVFLAPLACSDRGGGTLGVRWRIALMPYATALFGFISIARVPLATIFIEAGFAPTRQAVRP
jgi:hypothetical protein